MEKILKKFEGIDRFTPSHKLPANSIHIHKEVFRYNDLIIKYTNTEKNNAFLFENESFWYKCLQGVSFIPEFYGKYYLDGRIYLVIEYIDCKTLDREDKKRNKSLYSNYSLLKEKLYYVLDVFQKLNITHKDLRPHNILVSHDLSICKVIDFQFCSRIGRDIKTIDHKQKLFYNKAMLNVGGRWRQPNILQQDYHSDKYAIDKVLYDIYLKGMLSFIPENIWNIVYSLPYKLNLVKKQ